MSESGIYKITQNVDSRIYVGSAENFGGRFNRHINKLKADKHENSYLQNFYNKYPEAIFHFNLIELVPSLIDLIEREQFWLDETQCYEREIGFNICRKAGSCLGVKRTEEYKARLRGKNNPMFGKKRTPEQLKRLSELMTGIKRTEEFKAKFRGEKNPMFGKKHSPENIERMSKASMGNQNWKLRKPYSCETIEKISAATSNPVIHISDNGEFIKEYSSAIRAAKELNIRSSSNISAVCRKIQKTVEGHKFLYKSDYLAKYSYQPTLIAPVLL